MSEETKLPDRTEWQAQHVEIIAFPTESQLGVDQNWWSELTGSQPELSVRKPQKGEDSGIFDDVALSVEIDPFRVIWRVAPRIEDPPQVVPTLGPAFEKRDWLIELMGRWLEDCPPIKRLAFAAALLQFVDSREEAYRRLNSYLQCVEVDPDTSDFQYRVNRRRDSQTGVEDLSLNRLCTWGALKFSIGIRAVLPGTGETRDIPIREEQNACFLKLDINTNPDYPKPDLPHDALLRIFTELVDIGLQTAEQGDCR